MPYLPRGTPASSPSARDDCHLANVFPDPTEFSASGKTLTISDTRMVSVPWRSASSVNSTEVWIRAALTCTATNPDTRNRKITGTSSEICTWLVHSIYISDAADSGPPSTQYQLAPGS